MATQTRTKQKSKNDKIKAYPSNKVF